MVYNMKPKVSNFIVRRMSLKEMPKKVYRAPSSALFDPLSCRLCRNIGDASHLVNIFNPNNQQLLTIAEKLCGCSIVAHSSLPNLICRPCEQRLKNILEFQKVILTLRWRISRSNGSKP